MCHSDEKHAMLSNCSKDGGMLHFVMRKICEYIKLSWQRPTFGESPLRLPPFSRVYVYFNIKVTRCIKCAKVAVPFAFRAVCANGYCIQNRRKKPSRSSWHQACAEAGHFCAAVC